MKRQRCGVKQACGPKPGLLLKDLPRVGPKTLHFVDSNYNHTTLAGIDCTDYEEVALIGQAAAGYYGVDSRVDAVSTHKGRQGNRIRLKRVVVDVAFWIDSGTAAIGGSNETNHAQLKVFLVQDKCQTGGTLQPATKVFDIYSGSYAKSIFRTVEDRQRFNILAEKSVDVTYTMDQSTMYSKTAHARITYDCDIPIDFKDGSNGSTADMTHNNVYVILVPTSWPELDGDNAIGRGTDVRSRCYFTT